jgi:DNA (cytosine-5)-methyltransferase 1
VETHAKNHPRAEHLCEAVERIDPTHVIKGGKVNLLWASPECTHHSIARGGRPHSDQNRASAWLILKWLSELHVERVIIENVPEFLSWGPLNSSGQLIKNKKGHTFQAFITAMVSLGYTVDWKILCAADYGDPTTRRRLFIQAVKGHKKILWPQISHMDGVNLMGYQQWVPARDIIDWTIPGTSIFDRKKPLAEATLKRIAVGIEKYWSDYAKPFLAILHGASTVKSIDDPLTTVACSGAHHALIEPLVLEYYGNGKTDSVKKPLGTVTTKDRFALLEPFMVKCCHGGFDATRRTMSISDPVPTLTCSNENALIHNIGLDIRFRMLKNHELKRAQGFPDDYIITGNSTEQTKQIGNAVPVNTAKALALAAISA